MDDYSREPTAHEVLTGIMIEHKTAGRVWPHGLTLDPGKAASEWIAMQERQRPKQHRRDYVEQLAETLKRFLKLKKPQQIDVVACAEDGVYWRGDDLKNFFYHERSVYHETMKMREDRDAYRAQSKKQLGEFK